MLRDYVHVVLSFYPSKKVIDNRKNGRISLLPLLIVNFIAETDLKNSFAMTLCTYIFPNPSL